MLTVINVVAPVFAIVALGNLAVRFKLYPEAGVPGLITFVNSFVTPLLLFRAAYTLELSTEVFGQIAPFYVAAITVFAIAIFAARLAFKNRPGEAVSAGFSAMFSNTVLLGLPLMERAFGAPAMPILLAIIGVHAATLLSVGMVTMELAKQDGEPLGKVLLKAGFSLIKNPLLVGIVLGLTANFAGIQLPAVAQDFVDTMILAIVPVALFGLGGALNAYQVRDNLGHALFASILKLVLHPALVWVIMIPVLGIDFEIARYVILTAAMPAGINVYIFATFYNRSVDLAANVVLVSTVLSVFTISGWLIFLS